MYYREKCSFGYQNEWKVFLQDGESGRGMEIDIDGMKHRGHVLFYMFSLIENLVESEWLRKTWEAFSYELAK